MGQAVGKEVQSQLISLQHCHSEKGWRAMAALGVSQARRHGPLLVEHMKVVVTVFVCEFACECFLHGCGYRISQSWGLCAQRPIQCLSFQLSEFIAF